MITVTSELQPYNEIWLDCIKNNLISILISYNESFKTWPLTFKAQYWKKIISQKFSSEETYKSLLNQGLFLPKITYESDELYSYFNVNKSIVEPYELNNLHITIKKALQSQLFVFLKIDRFFYISGRESAKIHFEHPVFIYGYSDEEKSYLTLEDCLTPGTIHPYNLPYDVIDLSANYFIETKKNIELMTLSINKEKIRNHQFDISEEKLVSTFSLSNVDEVVYVEQSDLYYQVGISSLENYLDEADEILSNMVDEKMFVLRTKQFIENHKKNSLLISYLYSNGKIEDDQLFHLSEQIKNLSNNWKIYKNSTLKKIHSNNMTDLSEQKEYLKIIAVAERNIASKLALIAH